MSPKSPTTAGGRASCVIVRWYVRRQDAWRPGWQGRQLSDRAYPVRWKSAGVSRLARTERPSAAPPPATAAAVTAIRTGRLPIRGKGYRTFPARLFVPQRFLRVDARHAVDRGPGREERGPEHERGDRGEDRGVDHGHVPEDAVERAAEPEAAEEAQREAEQDRPQRLAEEHRHHVAGARAEGHPDAELVRALPHHPGHDAVDAGHREQDGERAEGREERSEETAVRHGGRVRDPLLHRHEVVGGLVAVHLLDRGLHGADEGERIAGGPDGEGFSGV